MRALAKPDYDPKFVYETCIDSIIKDNCLRNRLSKITVDVINAANAYNEKAENGQLFELPQNNQNKNIIISGKVTKFELNKLYTSYMVGKKDKPARKIYDKLLSKAPRGICPFCGLGIASTLDHYLPKTKYPLFSVLASNLVPACKDCNTGKKTKIAITAEEQCLHPYFDHNNFVDEQC
jgi:hypothetical protein